MIGFLTTLCKNIRYKFMISLSIQNEPTVSVIEALSNFWAAYVFVVHLGLLRFSIVRFGSSCLADADPFWWPTWNAIEICHTTGHAAQGRVQDKSKWPPEVGDIVACPRGCWCRSCWCCQSQPHYMSITAY